jgi:hypothetical protein
VQGLVGLGGPGYTDSASGELQGALAGGITRDDDGQLQPAIELGECGHLQLAHVPRHNLLQDDVNRAEREEAVLSRLHSERRRQLLDDRLQFGARRHDARRVEDHALVVRVGKPRLLREAVEAAMVLLARGLHA